MDDHFCPKLFFKLCCLKHPDGWNHCFCSLCFSQLFLACVFSYSCDWAKPRWSNNSCFLTSTFKKLQLVYRHVFFDVFWTCYCWVPNTHNRRNQQGCSAKAVPSFAVHAHTPTENVYTHIYIYIYVHTQLYVHIYIVYNIFGSSPCVMKHMTELDASSSFSSTAASAFFCVYLRLLSSVFRTCCRSSGVAR